MSNAPGDRRPPATLDAAGGDPRTEERRMAEVIGLGMTHYPMLAGEDTHMANLMKTVLKDPDIPTDRKDPATWSPLAQEEWGDDEGTTAADGHRAQLRAGLDRVRATLDEFEPDVLLVWGDDQYENFREEVIP